MKKGKLTKVLSAALAVAMLAAMGGCNNGEMCIRDRAYDTLGAASLRVAGVKIEEDTAKVVNLYESEEYAKMLEIVKDWYDKGYIYKDAATYAESAPDLIKTNVTGCYFVDSQLGVETSQSLATGYDMTCVKVIDGLIDSNSMKKFVWGIPEVAREPEAAMRFLDLM